MAQNLLLPDVKAVSKFIGCEVHTFDPTLSKPFIGDKYATFHPWGVGEDGSVNKFNGLEWTAKSIDTIVRKLDHADRKIDVLKIDCEGCEWTSLPPVFDAITNGTLKVDQILVELHRTPELKQTKPFFDKLDEAGMRVFHKERNHWGCSGYKCLEYAFVSESFLRQANAQHVC